MNDYNVCTFTTFASIHPSNYLFNLIDFKIKCLELHPLEKLTFIFCRHVKICNFLFILLFDITKIVYPITDGHTFGHFIPKLRGNFPTSAGVGISKYYYDNVTLKYI